MRVGGKLGNPSLITSTLDRGWVSDWGPAPAEWACHRHRLPLGVCASVAPSPTAADYRFAIGRRRNVGRAQKGPDSW